MAGSSGDAERNEPATARRLARARDEGQVALSREVVPACVLAVTALLLGPASAPIVGAVAGRLGLLLAGSDRLDPLAAATGALEAISLAVLPVAGLAAIASCAGVFGQTGLLVRLGALQPDIARVSPASGLRRVFGGSTLAEAARAAAKLAMVGFAAWYGLRGVRFGGLVWLASPATVWLDQVRRLALRLVLAALAGQALFAAFDVLRARLAFSASLRMSRHGIREEHRESEGDPQVKARIRRLRLQRGRRRMMAAVPQATVVVTNPTHYAIALSYERGSAGAPRVVAKGTDAMAERIREVAREARVPLIANAPLARALWRVELDAEVPPELFQAVAEVIATVWRLRAPRPRL